MNERSGPKAAPRTPAKKSIRKTTRRFTDLAANEPTPVDAHHLALLDAAIDAGELEEADGRG